MLDKSLDLKGFSSFPDLIMVDGGKGQVNIALEVLSDLGIDIPYAVLLKMISTKLGVLSIETKNIIYLRTHWALG